MLKTAFFSVMCMFLTVSSYAQASDSSSISCIQSVCGEKQTYTHPFENDPNLANAVYAKLTNELQVQKPIKHFIGRTIHLNLVQHRAFTFLQSQTSSFNISEKSKALILSLSYIKKISQYGAAINPDGKSFNQEALQKLLPNAPANEIEAIMSFNSLFSARDRFKGLLSKFDMMLPYLYPNKSIAEAQIIEAKRIQATQDKLWSYMPEMSFLTSIDPVVVKASRGEELNYLEKNHFTQAMASSATLEAVLADNIQQKFLALTLDISKILADFKKTYEGSRQFHMVKNPKTLKGLLEQNVNQCLANLTSAYAALPDNSQLQNFDIMAKTVLKTAKILRQEELYKSVMVPDDLGIKIIYPESRDKMIPSFLGVLKAVTADADEKFKRMQTFNFEDKKNLESYLILASAFNDEDIFEELQTHCDRGNVPTLDDSALSQSKIINLSWLTIQYPELGIGILAHEVGHVVRSMGSNGGVVPCLLQKQNNNYLYGSEDFADLFSAEILNRLNYQLGSTQLGNMSCVLLAYDQKTGWQPGQLTPYPGDNHSSGFYRLLAISAMTTGLTSQCKDHLKMINSTQFDDYCKWQPDTPKY